MSVLAEAYTAGRAEKLAQPKRRRDPLLHKAGRFLGRHAPAWSKVRTTVLTLSGFGCLDYAAYRWDLIAGLIATGVSLLVVEALSGGDK